MQSIIQDGESVSTVYIKKGQKTYKQPENKTKKEENYKLNGSTTEGKIAWESRLVLLNNWKNCLISNAQNEHSEWVVTPLISKSYWQLI